MALKKLALKKIDEAGTSAKAPEESLAAATIKDPPASFDFFESAPFCMATIDASGLIIRANGILREITGASEEHMSALPAADLVSPSHRSDFSAALKNVLATGVNSPVFRTSVIGKNNATLPMHACIAASSRTKLPGVSAMLSMTPVAVNGGAEERLVEAKSSLLAIINAVPHRIFWKDANKAYAGCNIFFAQDAGFSDPASIIGKRDADLIWSQSAKAHEDDDDRIIKTGIPKIVYEELRTRATGGSFWARMSKVPMYAADGSIIGVIGIYEDITKEKESIEALRADEERYRDYLRNLRGIAFQCDQDMKPDFISGAVEEITGYTAHDFLLGKIPWVSIIVADDREAYQKNIARLRSGDISLMDQEYRIECGNGDIKWIAESTKVVKNSEGKIISIQGVYMDVTTRKMADEETRIFASAIDNSFGAVFITDSKGTITYANQAAYDMYGYVKPEFIGASTDFLIASPDISGERIRQEALEKGSWSGELLKKKKDGALVPTLSTVSLVYARNKKPIGFVESSLDITERKAYEEKISTQAKQMSDNVSMLERSQQALISALDDAESEKKKSQQLVNDLQKFKLAVDHVDEQVVITDAKGVIVYANPAETAIAGFTLDEVLGKTPAIWGRQMSPEFYENFWRVLTKEKRPYSGEIRNKRKNGEIYLASIFAAPILDEKGDILFFVGLEKDITKQHEAERLKTEFVSLASHQLKTPLTIVSWYSEMLASKESGNLTDKQRQYVDEIYEANKRMINLVNALLNVSRIETGSFIIEPKPTDVAALANTLIDELAPVIEKAKITFNRSYSGDLSGVEVDPGLLKIIIQNLILNAIRYNKEGGSVDLIAKEDAGEVSIEVRDTGMGIPESQQPRVFEKFFRADNVREAVPDGTGLGLYIVKELVGAFQGKISFQSVVGQGTSFHITFPKKGIPPKPGRVSLQQ